MQTEVRIDLFTKPADVVDTAPVLANGTPPRGLTSAGWVRTTGWLQVGDRPVSSAHLVAVAGLLWAVVGAAVLMETFPVAAGVLILTAPVLCGVSWSFVTRWLWPASVARNVETKRAEELAPGDVIRLHGSIGPIGQVTEVAFGDDIRVAFHGGEQQSWARDHVVHVAELLS